MTSSPRVYKRETQPCLRGWGDFLRLPDRPASARPSQKWAGKGREHSWREDVKGVN